MKCIMWECLSLKVIFLTAKAYSSIIVSRISLKDLVTQNHYLSSSLILRRVRLSLLKMNFRRKILLLLHLVGWGGVKGGKARAEKLTPEQRSNIAKKAAKKRWQHKK